MKKKLSKIIAFMLIMVMVFSTTSINANAASYPIVFLDVTSTAIAGDNVEIRLSWFAVYNYEGYDITISDSNGTKVYTTSDTWMSGSGADYLKEITVCWDTDGMKGGEYTVEVTKKFYSLYRWNEAPTKLTATITLYNNPNNNSNNNPNNNSNHNSNHNSNNNSNDKTSKVIKPSKVTNLSIKNSRKKSIVIKFKKSKNAEKYKIQYSTDKKFKKGVKTKTTKKTTYTIKKLKKKSTYYVRVCAVNGDTKSNWSTIKKVKIKK